MQENDNSAKFSNKNLDWEAKKELCNLWKNTSGISMSKFCRQQGIPASSFRGWHRKLCPAKNKKTKKSNWVPVKIIQQTQQRKLNADTTTNLELLFPNNIIAKINMETKEVFNLIKELI